MHIFTLDHASGVFTISSFLCLFVAPNFLTQSVLFFGTYQFAFYPCDYLHQPHDLITAWCPFRYFILYRNVFCCCPSWFFYCSCITRSWNSYTCFNFHSTWGNVHPWRFSSHLLFHPWRCHPNCQISWLTLRWNGECSPFLAFSGFAPPPPRVTLGAEQQFRTLGDSFVYFRSLNLSLTFFMALYWITLSFSIVSQILCFLCGFSFLWLHASNSAGP